MTTDDLKGHRKRLQNRFLTAGTAGLADYELLELILMTAIPRKDVKPIAKMLIRHFGSFNKVLASDYNHLLAIDGIGPQTAHTIKLFHSTTQAFHKYAITKKVIRNKAEVYDYLYTQLADLDHEEFHVIFLDSKNGVIRAKSMFRGTINSSTVYPREVMKEGLECAAASIIVAHNHPSGDVTPSLDDEIMTTELVAAAKTVHIHVIDHIIIGHSQHYSFDDHGKL